jgi:hypothetical protein
MKKYEKLMSDILDSIFEGYSYDGELKVINEKAARKAAGSLHRLVLEKSRDLWDQLEAAEGSLADVAEEISFEELNTDPSSMDTSTGSSAPEPVEAAPAADDAGLGMEAPTLESILGTNSDIDFDSIFEMRPDHMMDAEGDPSEMVDGDQDYEDLEMGMDDNGMGSPDMEGDQLDGGQQGDQFGDEFGGQQGDQMGDQLGGQQGDQFGDEFGGQQGDQMGDQLGGQQMDGEIDLDSEGGFDFDLDLEGGDPDAEMEEGFGKAYRMEAKGDKDDDDKEDKDDDDKDSDDDDKKKKKGKKDLPWEKDDKDD